jgi:PAS domain S-box-containing protein
VLGVLALARGRGLSGVASCWTGSWIAWFVASVAADLAPESLGLRGVQALAGVLGPALCLAGAVSFAGHRLPAGLLPAAVALGAMRGALVVSGQEAAAWWLSLAVEPTATFAAAVLVGRATMRSPWRVSGAGIVAGLAAMTALEASVPLTALAGGSLRPLLRVFSVVGPATALLQWVVLGGQLRQARRRAEAERARIHAELMESERRLRAITDTAFDFIAELDVDGRLVYLSPRHHEVFGYAPSELRGRPLFDWIHPDDRATALGQLAELKRHGSAGPRVVRWRNRDGSYRWFESTARTFDSGTGRPRVIVSSRDVTERVEMERALRESQAWLEQRVAERTAELAAANAELAREVCERREIEQALRESEARYRIVSELSSDYSFAMEIQPDGRWRSLWVTGALTRITGYTLEEFDRIGWTRVVHPEDWPRVREEFRRIALGEPASLEYRIHDAAGRLRWLSVRARAERDPETGVTLLFAAAHDATERKRADEERRRLEARVFAAEKLESLGVLAGGIAHDFNNLLTTVLGNASAAELEAPPDSQLARRLARIRIAAEHAASLAGGLLDFAGRESFERKPVDVARLVEDTVELVAGTLPTGISVSLETAAPVVVRGDSTQLLRILMNLVSNAAEALGDRGGRIRVRSGEVAIGEAGDGEGDGAVAPGAYAFVEIEDDGPGMDAATRARIFEPFFTTKAAGRGLGLASAHGVVHAHGGALEVRSAPGKGTCVRVLLPRSQEPLSLHEAAAEPTGDSSAERATAVLVVDDEPWVGEVAAEFLERAGLAVRLATGGEAAVELLRSQPDSIDLVLLDLEMPGMSGAETYRALRALRPELPVVLVSGYDQDVASQRFGGGRLAGFLRKPYTPEMLIQRVRSVLV